MLLSFLNYMTTFAFPCINIRIFKAGFSVSFCVYWNKTAYILLWSQRWNQVKCRIILKDVSAGPSILLEVINWKVDFKKWCKDNNTYQVICPFTTTKYIFYSGTKHIRCLKKGNTARLFHLSLHCPLIVLFIHWNVHQRIDYDFNRNLYNSR